MSILSLREREVIVLRAVTEIINSAVNFEVLLIGGEDPNTEVRFKSLTHHKYFNIVMVDFLSPIDRTVVPTGGTFIDGLQAICSDPQFEPRAAIEPLRVAISRLDSWLSTEVQIETWMPSIDLQADLPVTRSLLIRIGGNVSKHNSLRLGRMAGEVQAIVAEAGHAIDLDQALLALPDVYERFHTDVLNYHGSTIAELLNNIRWGIHKYLQPEFCRSFTRDPPDPHKYHYLVPSDVQNKLAVDSYWAAMNDVRGEPWVRRFVVTEWLKKRY